MCGLSSTLALRRHQCTKSSKCCFPNNVAKYQIPVHDHILQNRSPSRGRTHKKSRTKTTVRSIMLTCIMTREKPGEVATTRIGLFWMMPLMSMAKSMIGRITSSIRFARCRNNNLASCLPPPPPSPRFRRSTIIPLRIVHQ